MKKLLPLLYLVLVVFAGCIRPKNAYTSLAPGLWRGALHLSTIPTLSLKDEIERYEQEGTKPVYDPEDELPFFFQVTYPEGSNNPYVEIINGTERIRIDEVYWGRNRNTAEDTIFIDFVLFDSHIRGIIREGIIEGEWVVRNKPNYKIPFSAHFGKKDKFQVVPGTPVKDLTGQWDCTFDLNLAKTSKAIAEFRQEGSLLQGTFRTPTGDYRYLDGTITGNKFYLSTFDGSHAYLFFGKVEGDSLLGSFKSGNHFLSLWSGYKNPVAELPSPLQMNKGTGQPVDFSFPDQDGQIKSMSQYKKSIQILQVMGTWCPNCYDETRFLTQYLKDNPTLDLGVIGLACERHRDTAKALNALKIYQKKMELPYDILLASTTTNKAVTSRQLPFLDSIIAYPTMIILDRDHKIHSIHTGFDGPATSKYEAFKKEFDQTIKSLINQPK
ncbi:MAG: TlpA disulfide reductase family protein [Saprospiraceae bacterium]|nr:TlpA disulfide reductase family protein [Saprospiraceae bacterium]